MENGRTFICNQLAVKTVFRSTFQQDVWMKILMLEL